MFIENKYTKWYYKICHSKYEGYTEKHHIIPKCLGGNNDKDNIVSISPKAHFLCHWLLTKMVENRYHKEKLYYAFNFMLLKPKNLKNKRYYPTSRIYELSRKYMKECNPSYNLETKNKISQKRKEAWKNPTLKMIEGIEKMRKSKIGNIPWNKGKKNVQLVTEETRKKLIEQRTGRKWFTDGEKSYFIKPEDSKDNMWLGRK